MSVYEAIGIAQPGFWGVANGSRSFTIEQLLAISKLTGVSITYILGVKKEALAS